MRLVRDKKGRLGFWVTTRKRKRVFIPLNTILKRVAILTSGVVSAHVAAYLFLRGFLRWRDYRYELQGLSKVFNSWRELKPRFVKSETVLAEEVIRKLKPSCLRDVRFLRVSNLPRAVKLLNPFGVITAEYVGYVVRGTYLPRTRIIVFEDRRYAVHELGHHVFYHVLNPLQRRRIKLIANRIVKAKPFRGDARTISFLRWYLEDPSEMFAYAFQKWATGKTLHLYHKNSLDPLVDWIEKNLLR